MFALAETLEKERISHAVETSLNHKETFGQYFTPFLEKTSFEYTWKINETYTHVIMNPPYKKIQTNSKERQSARAFGLETVNFKIWGETYNG